MATRAGATKTVGGKRYRYNGTKWVQIKAQGNTTPTSSRNRGARSNNSTARVTGPNRNTSGSASSRVTGGQKALPPSKGGRITSTNKATPTSQRVQPVRVRVEGQRQLPGTRGQNALPPGQRGGAVSTSNRPRRTNINSNPSSNTTRTGSQSPGSAAREVQATRRAGTQGRNPGVRNGLVAPLLAGTAVADWMVDNLPRTATPSGRGTGRATDRVRPGPPKKDERNNNAAEINARLKKEKEARQRALARTRGGNNSQLLREPESAKDKPARDTPTPRTPTRTTPTRTAPTRTTPPRKAQSKDMDANYKAWAKANPKLAKKVKKGQAGYKAINSSSSTPKAAGPSNAQDLRSGRRPPSNRTTLKSTPTKPTPAKQKPLAVDVDNIPKNLNSPAGKKYLADLDAGKLTRKKKK